MDATTPRWVILSAALIGVRKNAQLPALPHHAACPETVDALDVLHRGHLGPNPHPGGIYYLQDVIVFHLTRNTISKSPRRNNPHLGDFLNKVFATPLRVDHIAD
jgi:hypothetical protein